MSQSSFVVDLTIFRTFVSSCGADFHFVSCFKSIVFYRTFICTIPTAIFSAFVFRYIFLLYVRKIMLLFFQGQGKDVVQTAATE